MTKGIVFGAGKSFWRDGTIDEIADLVKNGKLHDIYFGVSDRIAEKLIQKGITPQNSNFIMVTQESFHSHKTKSVDQVRERFREFYFNKDVSKYCFSGNSSIWYSLTSDPILYEEINKKFTSVYQFYRNQAKESTERISNICPRFECSNVGEAAYNILRMIYGCNSIAFLGLDFSHSDYDVTPDVYQKWQNEGEMTLNTLRKYQDDIAHWNLSKSGLFYESNQLYNSNLEDFLTDKIKIPVVEGNPRW